jgi:hypothetical protein
MAKRIPLKLHRSIKDHGRLLHKVSQKGGNRLLKNVPKTFFGLIKTLFHYVKKGGIPVPLSLNQSLLSKVLRAKNTGRTIIQNGSGIVSILAHVVPALVSLVPEIVKFFKKK